MYGFLISGHDTNTQYYRAIVINGNISHNDCQSISVIEVKPSYTGVTRLFKKLQFLYFDKQPKQLATAWLGRATTNTSSEISLYYTLLNDTCPNNNYGMKNVYSAAKLITDLGTDFRNLTSSTIKSMVVNTNENIPVFLFSMFDTNKQKYTISYIVCLNRTCNQYEIHDINLNVTITHTNAPTASPTTSPTFSPTHAPTNSPTIPPSMTPTMAPTIDKAAHVSFVDSITMMLDYLAANKLVLIGVVMILITFVLTLCSWGIVKHWNRKSPESRVGANKIKIDSNHFVIGRSMLELYDVITDVAYSVHLFRVYSDDKSTLIYLAKYGMLFSIGCSYLANFIGIFIFFKMGFKKSVKFVEWFENHSRYIVLMATLSIFDIKLLYLFNSRIFASKYIFNAPIDKSMIYFINIYSILSLALENIPQLVVQFFIALKEYHLNFTQNTVVIVAFIITCLDILNMFVSCLLWSMLYCSLKSQNSHSIASVDDHDTTGKVIKKSRTETINESVGGAIVNEQAGINESDHGAPLLSESLVS